MNKIDFFGGAHGNFLELVIDTFVNQHDYDFNQPVFNSNGACHLKDHNPNYAPDIKAKHWSTWNIPFDPQDQVIEIHVEPEWMLALLVNSFMRAGLETIDITDLENHTLKKLYDIDKARPFVEDLIQEHGEHEHYPRSVIRNYFYSKFNDPVNGIDQFNQFQFKGKSHIFPFSAFFDLDQFYFHLNQCAYFLNQDFIARPECASLWKQFLELNQGYASQLRCNQIIEDILLGNSTSMPDLTLIEEAWINYRISAIFRCYDHPLLTNDVYPTNTKQISDAIYLWKSQQ